MGEEVIEEGVTAKPVSQPERPSRREVQEHELTHIPFRSWCVHCMRGAGRANPHRAKDDGGEEIEEERQQGITTWSMDYGFMVEGGELYSRKELAEQNIEEGKARATVMVWEDSRTGGVKAHVVKNKGTSDGWIAGRIRDDMEEIGYGGTAEPL